VTTASTGAVVVTEAPEGVLVTGWLFKTATWSKGDTVATPENSQMTAAPLFPLGFGVMLTLVAPDVLFGAYQMSTILAEESTALALLAST
jgi:hypothetical protein